MKPVFEKIPLSKTSFIFKDESFPFYNTFWHSHPEFEIAFLLNGNGKILAGDGLSQIMINDVILFGPNLPHSWYSEDMSNTATSEVRQIIIQFPEDLLGNDWLSINEFIHFKELFQKAEYGIRFTGQARQRIAAGIMKMLEFKELERMLSLMRLLDLMARASNYELLSKASFSDKLNHKASSKINAIFMYIQQNFKDQITMESVAEFAHMNPSAFSRYFKRRTFKTFKEFLNEIRVSHACKLLMEEQFNITQVCYESGFNNISNFNRQFKKIKGLTPVEYQKHFKK